MFRSLPIFVALACGVCIPVALADDGKSPANEKTPEQLSAELDSESFATRQAASAELARLGKAALPELEKVAASESAEASTRAFEILRNHAQGSDVELQAAAKETLQRIAKSENSSAARRAQDVLNAKQVQTAPTDPNVPPGRIRFGGIAGRGVPIRIEALIKGGARRISIKNVNGVKDIEAEEENRTVKIHDDPEEGIKVEVTEKKEGKEEKKEYEAKDAAELKEKHPEAHKIYEQYSQGGAIKIDGLRLERRIAPAIPVAPLERAVPIPAPAPKEIRERLEKAERDLEEAKAQLRERIKDAEDVAELEQALKALEETQQRLKEAVEQTGKP